MKVGDLVRKIHTKYAVPTAVIFKNGSVHIVTETRINWIKVLAYGESVGWLRAEEWEIVNENG